jgi:hypothetical protein
MARRIEGAGHGERGDQALVRRLLDGRPVAVEARHLEIGPERLQQAVPVDVVGVLAQVVAEALEVRDGPAVTLLEGQLLGDVEADQSGECDQIAPVLGLGEGDDAPDTAGAVGLGAAGILAIGRTAGRVS